MKKLFVLATILCAQGAAADTSCLLTPLSGGDPTTLLIHSADAGHRAVILVSGKTMTFDCAPEGGSAGLECYGSKPPPLSAPTQLNVASEHVEAGAVVILSVRNMFFGKNRHIGYHRRHASMQAFLVERCDRF